MLMAWLVTSSVLLLQTDWWWFNTFFSDLWSGLVSVRFPAEAPLLWGDATNVQTIKLCPAGYYIVASWYQPWEPGWRDSAFLSPFSSVWRSSSCPGLCPGPRETQGSTNTTPGVILLSLTNMTLLVTKLSLTNTTRVATLLCPTNTTPQVKIGIQFLFNSSFPLQVTKPSLTRRTKMAGRWEVNRNVT